MSTTVSNERKRIHPYKFTLWVAIGSITMMFAGLTSAYLVRSAQDNWLEFQLPIIFWISTAVMLLSSLFIYNAGKAFRKRQIPLYKKMMLLTGVAGLVFIALQLFGFYYLQNNGVLIVKSGSNPAGSFLGVIFGLHGLHVLGGAIALAVVIRKAFSTKVKTYDTLSLDLITTYWHFIGILWIYLLLFFLVA